MKPPRTPGPEAAAAGSGGRGAASGSRACPTNATVLQPVPTDRHRKCEVCGNEYDKTFEVIRGGHSHVFDCFECAVHALAPCCAHCGCRILGHGMESVGEMYCCAHCAQSRGVASMKDRA